jgi:hypothetical protein
MGGNQPEIHLFRSPCGSENKNCSEKFPSRKGQGTRTGESTSSAEEIPNWDAEIIMGLCDNSYNSQYKYGNPPSDAPNRKIIQLATRTMDDSKTLFSFENLENGHYFVVFMNCHRHGRSAQVTGALDWSGGESSSNSTATSQSTDDDDPSVVDDDDDDDVFVEEDGPRLAKYIIIAAVALLGVWALVTYYRRREIARWHEYRTHQLLQAQDEAFDVTDDDDDTFDLELVEHN